MIGVGTLITWAIVAAAVTGAVAGTFRFFADFVTKVLNSSMKKFRRLLGKLKKEVLAGAKCFAQKVWKGTKEVVRAIVKEYIHVRDTLVWRIRETTTEVPPDKVPAEIRRNAEFLSGKEYDVTNDVVLELKRSA
ncbi:MAG: hypothetical protein II876_03015 [Synergistaceae bacterium]|nr:hypothetical protein [Synergistaceae bacterium]